MLVSTPYALGRNVSYPLRVYRSGTSERHGNQHECGCACGPSGSSPENISGLFCVNVQAHSELWQRFVQAIRIKNLLTTGPMTQRTACPQQDGIMFIGDAAGFFDPFTGQGIYLALHSATLAAAGRIVHCSGALSADALRSYFLAHRQAFRDKYRLSALFNWGSASHG